MLLTISVGNSRKETNWQLRQLSWEELKNKLSSTVRTEETQEAFMKMNRYRQNDIKDIGGFVGGELIDGDRRKFSVRSRSVLTLDMDKARSLPETIETLHTIGTFSYCIYSTHKHTPENPRLRIIIPFARTVSADEYEAISRQVASDVGMDQFDDTTHEPNRLMFWPSTSKDGEYIFEASEGPFLDPNQILNRYEDWQDVSSWPAHGERSKAMYNKEKTQSDPLLKNGLVGAFCRSYGVSDAIDRFLSDVYQPSIVSDRYDYISADSAAGVVIYDDRFAFSHHATDPASGRLLNAFDLVRVHKFEDLDEGCDTETLSTKLPSFQAMSTLALDDEQVIKQLDEDRRVSAMEDFNDATDEDSWFTKLTLSSKGDVQNTLRNITLILENDPLFQPIAYNELSHRIDVTGELPWNQVKSGWGDADLSRAKVLLDKVYGIYSPNKFKDALIAVAADRAFHPIKKYFEQLPEWDRTSRIDRLLIDYFGAEDNAYVRAIMRKTLIAAVARIFDPGVKFDNVLILIGEQGIGKSSFFSKLAMQWFSDSLTLTDMRDKSSAEKLQGYWILELGELAGLRKMDLELVKAFITRQDDKFRQSYGVYVESHPRQCIIVGTTNAEQGILRDVTGNRRYWPVKVGRGEKEIWHDLTQAEVAQIWSEAYLSYKNGETLTLPSEASELALEYQKEAMEEDDREGLIHQYLETLLPEDWSDKQLHERRAFLSGDTLLDQEAEQGTQRRMMVCLQEIWCECLGKDRSDLKRSQSFELQGILKKIGGWHRYTGSKSGKMRQPIYGVQVTYERVNN